MKRVLPILAVLWFFIIAVCFADVYLAYRYSHSLADMELNPIGRWLISLDGGNPALFLSVKWLCNLIMMLLLILNRSRPIATYAVAVAQSILLFVFWS